MKAEQVTIRDVDISIWSIIKITFKFWVAQILIGLFFSTIGFVIFFLISLLGFGLVAAS